MGRIAFAVATAAVLASGCATGPEITLPTNWDALTAPSAGGTARQCPAARVETYSFVDEHGRHVDAIDRHRCGVVELHVVDRIDDGRGLRVRDVYRDRDHDGAFEDRKRFERPLAEPQ